MLKSQCSSCRHKIAVPDNFGGKRVKCPKCQAAVLVPLPVPEAAAALQPHDPGYARKQTRARRRGWEQQRKSHNTMVAVFAGFILVVGLGVLLVVGMNNRPEPSGPTEVAATHSTDTGKTKLAPIKARPETARLSRTMGASDGLALQATSTFDVASGTTTMVVKSSPLPVGDDRMLQMSMTVEFDGREIQQATRMSAKLRLRGQFEGLISGANSDEPQLVLVIDDREYPALTPSAQDQSDARKQVNGPEILPGWVEYTLGRVELMALARSQSFTGALGPATFNFSPPQMALMRTFAPPRAVIAPGASRTAEEIADDGDPITDTGTSRPKTRVQDDEKEAEMVEEEIDDKEMMKRK